MRCTMAQLDKFYTKPDIAKQCLDFLYEKIPDIKNKQFMKDFTKQ